ncbi:MAG TPA: ABC transporter permease [Candidatus Dormibacteraeota bacterium]|nr:ABC transporter permease [Candidatus Dormibacteraeota bacterium]
MNPTRILAIARRIAQGFRRDERTLGLMFVVPLVVTALLGWVLRDTKDTNVRIEIVNTDQTVGTHIVSALTALASDPANGIAIAGTVASRDDAVAAIKAGNADLALVIPSDLVAAVAAGQRPTLTVITEGTEPGAEASQFGKLQKAVATLTGSLAPPGGSPAIIPQIAHETVYLTPNATQVDVLAPIFLGFFGYFFVFLLTGISFLRERIGGTLERLLATPVTRTEIVFGYSLGFGAFATIQVIVLTLFILNSINVPAIGPIPAFSIGLGVNSAGSPVLAFLIAFLLSIGAVNLGIFLSTFARTELQVIQFIPLVIVPQGLLGGLLFPVNQLPDALNAVAHVLPLTYAIEGLREVMLKGADLSSRIVQTDLLVLAGIAIFFVALASTTIKREVA